MSEQEEVLFNGSDSIDYSEEADKLDENSSSSGGDTVYVKVAPGINKVKFVGEGTKKFQKFEKQEDGSYDVTELDEETVEEIEDRRTELYNQLYEYVNDSNEAENVDDLRQVYEQEFTDPEEVEELLDELDHVSEELDKISKQVQYPVELIEGGFIAGDETITETQDDTTYIYSVTYGSTRSSQWGQLVDLAQRKGGLEDEVVIIKRDGTGNDTQYSVLDPDSL